MTPIAAAAENGYQDVAKSLELFLREKTDCTKNGECPSRESEQSPDAPKRELQEDTFARGLTESVLANNPAKVREALKMLTLQYFEGSFQSLLERTVQPVLHLAAAHGSSEIADLLIQTGANANWQLEVRYVLACEKSPEDHFSDEDHYYLPDSLVKLVKGNQEGLGLDLMVRPLHLAINRCFPDVVELLVRSGADINVISYTLHPPPPLHFAAEKSSWEILRILLSENGEIRRDRCGATALHYAAISGSIEKVEELVRVGFYPDDKDYGGWSPLDWLEKVDPASDRQSSPIGSFLQKACTVSHRPSTWARAIQMMRYVKLRRNEKTKNGSR